MAQVQGVVLSVSLSTQVKKQTGGTYEAWELVYKGVDGEVRSFQKPVQGLKFNAKLKEQLISLKQGEEFTAVTDKNAAGFIEVKSIEKGLVEVQQPKVESGKQTSNNYQPREFETAAERAKKQVYINRLACLNTAAAITSAGAKTAPDVKTVIVIAEELYNYVTSDVSINQIESDIPY